MAESLVAERPLRIGRVAELLGLHRDAVKNIPASELPYFRVGTRGDRRYARADVSSYIERRRAAE